MNAQYCYQVLQQRHMDQVMDLAQTFQRGLSLRDNVIAQYELNECLMRLLLGEITSLHSTSFKFCSIVLK